MKKFIIFIALVLCLPCSSFAHPGGTDESGGHYDRSDGTYHYHHGYSAHQHTDGYCPYDFDDNVDHEYKKESSIGYTPVTEKKEEQSWWDKFSEKADPIFAAVAVFVSSLYFISLFGGILSAIPIFSWLKKPSEKLAELFAYIVCMIVWLPALPFSIYFWTKDKIETHRKK